MRKLYLETKFSGEVAQSVERETENLCVGGSIPSLAIPPNNYQSQGIEFNIGEIFYISQKEFM